MTHHTRFILLLALALNSLLATPSLAAHRADAAPGPLGLWRVANGEAIVRILHCGGKTGTLWGAIVWEKSPGLDTQNPDDARRRLPITGLSILRGFTPDADDATRFQGSIYNAEDGKIYDGSITLKDPDTLQLQGCLLPGIMCGGEDWARVAALPHGAKAPAEKAICQRALAEPAPQ